jgi:hypothetical protein
MADLLLQPTRNPILFEVIAHGRIVGRVAMFAAHRNRSTPWLWSIELPFREGRGPAYGYEATREAAMEAFVRSWRGEA